MEKMIKSDGGLVPLKCCGCHLWDSTEGRCVGLVCSRVEHEKVGVDKVFEKKTLTQDDINDIIKETEIITMTMFGKTTIVVAKLPSGFVIVESSSCVSSDNYDVEIGKEICMERIENKIWELEGYKLQSKIGGN